MMTTGRNCLTGVAPALGVALILLAAGCAAGNAHVEASPVMADRPVISGFPPFPDTGVVHGAADVGQAVQPGAEAAARSAGASVSGTDLVLGSAQDGLEYGLFSYDTGGAGLLAIAVDLAESSGGGVWVVLADHGRRQWEFRGPYASAGVVSLDDLNEGIYENLEGYTHVLVVAAGGVTATVGSVTFTTDDTPADVSISGNILGDPGEVPLEGVTLTLTPGGATAQTDGAGNYSLSGVAEGQYVITPVLSGYSFNPVSYNLNLQGLATDVDFYGLPEG